MKTLTVFLLSVLLMFALINVISATPVAAPDASAVADADPEADPGIGGLLKVLGKVFPKAVKVAAHLAPSQDEKK
uniref:Venom peptide n=1 Tax=Dasymutilla gloriosa TaxID=50628 RepID=A0A8T9VRF9_DASGL|nr:venom peptide precursor [Dasymutilla gloriosa]